MRLLSFRRVLSLVAIFTLAAAFGVAAFAQEFTGSVPAVPAANAQPLLAARTVQDDAAHSVALHTREVPTTGAKDLGRAAGETRMGLVVVLQRPAAQERALDEFVKQAESPDSPLYGKPLTPTEFASRFGLAASDLGVVSKWLAAKGFQVGNVDNGRLTIDFSGNAAQVEDAFHAEIHVYKSADGTQHYANATELQVPRQLARLISTVEGTQNFTAMERPNYDGPVTDFVLGTELQNKVQAEASAFPMPVHLTGEALHDASFTASKATLNLKDGATTLNVRIGGDSHPAKGSLTISSEEHGVIAVIRDITECEAYNSGYGRSCTIDFKPGVAGIHTLHAVYSGDDNFAAERQSLTIVANAASGVVTQVATINPINYYCPGYSSTAPTYCTTSGSSGTINYVLSWAGSLGQPTGSVAFSLKSGFTPGTLQLPASGSTTSSGSCSANNGLTGTSLVTFGTCSYACTYMASQQLISCTLTDTAMNQVFQASSAGLSVKAAFTDTDGNYANVAAAGVTEGYIAIDNAALTATVTASPTLTASTYGQTTAENSFAITFAPTSGTVVNYEGSSSGPFFELTGGNQLGSLINDSALIAACTTACIAPENSSGAGITWTVPAVVTPGTYPLTLTFSGTGASTSGSYTSWYKQAVSSSTINLQVNQAQPTVTMATPTATSPVSQPYGTTTAFNVTATLGWPGVGAAPTAADVTFASTAAGSFGAITCANLNTTGTGNTTASTETCTATFTPAGTSNVGSYSFSVSYAGDLNYSTASASTITGDLMITKATTTLALSSTAAGTTTAGVTTAPVTATTNVSVSGITVTFTDATTGAVLGTATTNSSGVATFNVTTSLTGVVGGLNNITASIASTSNYTAATATAYPVYLQGVLYTTTGLHDFSTDPGTTDGTKLGPYGVTIYNFTAASQPLTFSFTNASSGAFNYVTNCGATLAAGANCAYQFYYAPPFGDGNSTTVGQYESASWNVAVQSGVLRGLGDAGFDRSGAVTLPGTLAGKALLATASLSVSPTSYNFGGLAAGATSNTLTIAVQNTNGVPVAFTYTGPSTSAFTVTSNTCVTPLAANSQCNIYVTFGGTNPAGYSDTITITPSGGSAIPVSLRGTIESNSGLTLSSSGHSFGNVTDGTTASYGFTITNNSGAAATLGVSYSAATGYTVANGCGTTLAAAASCGVTVTFAPTTVATLNDAITLTSSVPIVPGGTASSPYSATVSVTGAGVAGGNLTATSVKHSFGNVPVGDSAGNYGVQLSNNTSAPVTLSLGSGFTNGTNGFTIVGTNCGAALAVNASCELIFSFTPTAVGTVGASYGITSSAPMYSGGVVVSPSQITLSGTGQ